MTLDFTERELKLAGQVGWQVGSHWPRVDAAEVVADLHLWLCENHHYVQRWRDAGEHGRNKLNLSLRRRANKFCRRERDVIKPNRPDYVYPTAAVGPLLAALFQYDDWTDIVQDGDSDIWASLADVSRAYDTLNATDKLLLRWRLGSGLRFAEIAEELDLPSPDAARMRVNRALARVAERASDGSARWTPRMDFRDRGRLVGAGENDPIHPEMVEERA